MKTYVTKTGDHWDQIAYSEMGGTKYTCELMRANARYTKVYEFGEGVSLTIPDVQEAAGDSLPPWRRAKG